MKFKSVRVWGAAVTVALSLSSWAAGMGTGTLTLCDAFGSGNGGWKLNVSAMEVHVPLVVVDAVGRAIEGFDATLQLGGEGGLADAGYKLNASGKMVETTWWGTLNQSIFHLVGRQQLHQSNGATYNFDHAEISMNDGASWNTVYCDTPFCIANPQQCMDICCQSCSSPDLVESYGWYAYDTYGIGSLLSNDNHAVRIKAVYRLVATEKSYGTLTLVDGFERAWKASVDRATTIHVPLEFYDTANNPIEDHYDATFELGETSGNGNAGYVLNANEGIVETSWGSMNQSLFYLIGRREWRAADNTRYLFDHAQISMDGGGTWAPVFTDTPAGSANPRQLLDFCCYDCSSDSYTGEYGWKIRSTTGDEHFIDNDEHSVRLRLFYRPTLLGDAYTFPILDAAKTGITFRLFDYTADVNSPANGLAGYFNFRASTTSQTFINENTDADGFTLAHATVLPTLVDGYPVFSGTRNGTRYCDDKSLRYLFDGEAHGVGVTEYPVVNAPLILQGDGSYVYDSRTNACDYDEERQLLLVRNYVERTSAAAEYSSRDYDYYDFLPFAHWDGMTIKTYTRGDFSCQYQYEKEETAYWFGYTMEYDFTTPAANVADSSFVFSGDDDVWVFIDDVLVLDLGGTHGMCTGTIDFKTGNVTAHLDWQGAQEPAYQTTIMAQFAKAGQTYVDREEWVGNTFCPNTPHHLKMFYLERGGGVANCNVRFSMAVTPEVFTMPKSLWITDHQDAGEGAVFLAFQPIFDEEVELRGWIEKANAEKRIKVAFGKTPEQIETAAATVAPLRAPDGQQNVTNGWVWIKVEMPGAGVDAESLLWKVVIDGVPDRDVNEDAVEKVSINEIMAKNGETFATVNGTRGLDWIELRNDGDSAVDVAGWYLSDNPNKKQSKWAKIEGSAVVPAHGTLIVWADKDFDGFSEREAFTRIGLSEDGEALFLADRFGEVKTRIDFPAQIKDVSYGVASNGSGAWGYFSAPTPNARNGATVAEDITPPVVFSEPHGYKTAPVTVAISCPSSPEAEIRYTTDGSFPTAQSSLYDREQPIRIDRTTCLRAAVVNSRSILQQDNSATYIFLDDVLSEQASSAAPAGFPADRAVNNHRMVYGLVDLPAEGTEDRARLLRGFTNSIATISFVVDPQALFDSTTGIYVNPDPANEGEAWERRIMLEQIDPTEQIADPAQERNGFTIPAGLRLRGAHSRTVDYPKHSFRLFFRGKYGAGALKFPLFGSEGADKFQKVDLRTSQNYSWANEAAEGDTFVHETFERDTQRALGVYYTRSRYYHLFINGRYWGLYQTQERGDEDFAETYDKGDAANYDVVKTSTVGGQRAFGASEGTIDAWSNLWHVVVNEGVDGDKAANYWRLQGLDPDGTRNPAYPILLNPYNLMAYLLVGHFTVDGDCPVSVWGGFPNNIYAVRNRVDSDSKNPGFFFLRHDGELCMGTSTVETRLPYEDYRRTYSYCSNDPTLWGTEAYSADYATFAKFNPAELHWRLCRNPDYRLAFADVFYRECLKAGGALTAPVAKARFESRMAEIDSAIVCEAARWARKGQTRTTWVENCAKCLVFIEERIPYLLAQYRARGWYPSIDAPTIAVADGKATFTAAHPVYYTLDGSDPRTNGIPAPEGGVALPETGTTVIRARCTSSTEWSAQNEETFVGRDE